MKFFKLFLVYLFVNILPSNPIFSQVPNTVVSEDSSTVIELNRLGYNTRLVDPEQAFNYGNRALTLAQKLNYKPGIAEAYRIRGIGKYYQNQSDTAIQNYLTSLKYFEGLRDLTGKAKVFNNIGNLYRDVDYDKGLSYFNQSLKIAKQLNIKDLIAGLYLNIGTMYQKKKSYNTALANYTKSYEQFNVLQNFTGITQCLQNFSIVYRYLNQMDKAESYAKQAIAKAKQNDLNFIIAGTNLTLSNVFIAQQRFSEAESSIKEGIAFSKIIKDEKLLYDYQYTSYLLENKRKNYAKAVEYLAQVYKQDSIGYKNFVSNKISLLQQQFKARETQRENELTIAKQKINRILVWASTLVSLLLVVVIILLNYNVRKKAKTNKQLTALNKEVSLQKENLNRINLNLEEIIDERTKDLKNKNQKLSQYSAHLSHQIRGPVSTLKGLLSLEKEDLIEQDEFIAQMEKCVNDIDDQILNINTTLHDPQTYGLKNYPLTES